jgi:hypothetical protein
MYYGRLSSHRVLRVSTAPLVVHEVLLCVLIACHCHCVPQVAATVLHYLHFTWILEHFRSCKERPVFPGASEFLQHGDIASHEYTAPSCWQRLPAAHLAMSWSLLLALKYDDRPINVMEF